MLPANQSGAVLLMLFQVFKVLTLALKSSSDMSMLAWYGDGTLALLDENPNAVQSLRIICCLKLEMYDPEHLMTVHTK